jgi:hypothetical protein
MSVGTGSTCRPALRRPSSMCPWSSGRNQGGRPRTYQSKLPGTIADAQPPPPARHACLRGGYAHILSEKVIFVVPTKVGTQGLQSLAPGSPRARGRRVSLSGGYSGGFFHGKPLRQRDVCMPQRLWERAREGPTRYTRTGRAMFLSCCSPRSSKGRSSLPAASSCTRAETQMPPGRLSLRAGRRQDPFLVGADRPAAPRGICRTAEGSSELDLGQ